jgi:hypothetical protein
LKSENTALQQISCENPQQVQGEGENDCPPGTGGVAALMLISVSTYCPRTSFSSPTFPRILNARSQVPEM